MKRAAQSEAWKSTEAVFHKLLRTFGLLRQIMEPYFGRFGISGPQWGVLRVLQRAEFAGEPALRLRDIGERLFVQPPSVTTIVDRLERQGLVKRMGSKADLRVRRVRLTPNARKLMGMVLEGHAAQIKSLFRPLSAQEMDQLLDLLTKLHAHLQSLVPRQATSILSRKKAATLTKKTV
jgi:DNA-binding MarR family transcriptional regulator